MQVREVQVTDLLTYNYTVRGLQPLDKEMEKLALTTILKTKNDMVFMDHSDKISKLKNYHFFFFDTGSHVAQDGLQFTM